MKITIPEVIHLFKYYYSLEGNLCGGSLHIVLEDGNIRDSHIKWCRNRAITMRDSLGIILADILLVMSKSQRQRLYLKHSFYPSIIK